MEENQNVVTTEVKKEGSSFGWGVLGFFVPIVGLILFLVWMKTKTKASKAAGIGALIGAILIVILPVTSIIVFPRIIHNIISLNVGNGSSYDITVRKTSEIENNGYYGDALESKYYTYLYTADLDPEEATLDFYKDVNFNVYDSNKTLLFKIVWDKVGAGIDKDCKYIMNSGESFTNSECVLYSYDFAYYNNLMVFGDAKTMRKDFYVYDMTSNKLTEIFTKTDNPNFDVIDYNIDNRDSLVFTTFYSNYNNNEGSVGIKKRDIVRDIENDNDPNLAINTLSDLEKRLQEAGLDNFIVERIITFTKGKNGYAQKDVKEKTIKEYFNEVKGLTPNINNRIKECTGITKKGSNKYEYVMDVKNESSGCKTLTYKLNDDFTFKFEISDNNGYESSNMYVNGKAVDSGLLYDQDIVYINGKTLITRAFSTDLGAPILLINTKGEIYSIEGYSEGKPYSGKDILNIDNKTKRNYKVDDNGNLIVSGTIHSNQCGDYLGTECVSNICGSSLEDLLKKYNVDRDYAYEADYVFKLKSDGLYDLKYDKSTTTETLEQKYSTLCNR